MFLAQYFRFFIFIFCHFRFKEPGEIEGEWVRRKREVKIHNWASLPRSKEVARCSKLEVIDTGLSNRYREIHLRRLNSTSSEQSGNHGVPYARHGKSVSSFQRVNLKIYRLQYESTWIPFRNLRRARIENIPTDTRGSINIKVIVSSDFKKWRWTAN